MKSDLTILYYTANRIPATLRKAVMEQLYICAEEGDYPLLSVSQQPMFYGRNLCVGDIGASNMNLYTQVLYGAKHVETKFVALCEDDVLYHPSHFFAHRPAPDIFAYNANKWGLYTWQMQPIVYCYKENRCVLNQCIAPTALLVEALTERFNSKLAVSKANSTVFAEPGRYERHLKVTMRQKESFTSRFPNVVFSHVDALGFAQLGRRKALSETRTEILEPWGKASELLEKCFGKAECQRQRHTGSK